MPGADATGGAPLTPRDAAWGRFEAACDRLLEKRRSQRGMYTLGDDHDAQLAAALAEVAIPPGADSSSLVEAGQRLGRHVFARRMFEDSYAGAVIMLSTALMACGIGTLRIEQVFHRTARLAYERAPTFAPRDPRAADEFLAGVLSGFMSEAFNCEATALAEDVHRFELVLGAGRDVNRGRSP